MIMSIYLHDEIASILKCYGTLEEVINKVLDAGSAGFFEFEDKPEAPNRSGARRYIVDVRNEDYLQLYMLRGNSPKISIRRILYWFVENEMYEVLGWELKNEYVDKYTASRKRAITRARQQLESLTKYLSGDDYEEANNALDIVKSLEDKYGKYVV